jgi:tungstate transport system ATP-binding protein
LALRTKVLLLDEPTANVDEESAQLIAQVILDARRMWGALPLIATHDLQWLDSVTQRRIFMRRGRIERQPA